MECQAKVQDGMLRVKITIAAYVRLPCKVSCLVSTLRWGGGAGEGGGGGLAGGGKLVFFFFFFF